MIIESVHVRNFLSHSDSSVDFSDAPMWLICGDNGAGKSALFDAVEYALYGRHHGGGYGAGLLVKHGQSRTAIEVVIRLDGERYRVSRHLDAEKGNLGGQIARWDAARDRWAPLNVGDGRTAAWDWLEGRLPPHDLYCSGIFLRQNDTAHFLSGPAGDKAKRVAVLIDLDAYCRLAVASSREAETARRKILQREGMLKELGDVSEATCGALESQLVEARAA